MKIDYIEIDLLDRTYNSSYAAYTKKELKNSGYKKDSVAIYGTEQIYDELNNCIIDKSNESGTLMHELAHVFEYKELENNSTYNYCFHYEPWAILFTEYMFRTTGKKSCKGTNCYVNNRENIDNKAAAGNKNYWLAKKILEIGDDVGQETIYSVMRNMKGTCDNYYEFKGYRFADFIDNWSNTTGKNIWKYFTTSDIKKMEELDFLGEIKRMTTIDSATVKGNKSQEENKLDFDQDDTEAIVTFNVKSKTKPSKVEVKLGKNNNWQEIQDEPTKNGENYTYKVKIDLSTEESRKNFLEYSYLYIEVYKTLELQDANIEEVENFEQEINGEGNTEASKIEITSIQGNKSKKEGTVNLDDDEEINIAINVNRNASSVEISIGNEKKKFSAEAKEQDGKIIYTKTIPLTEEIKSILKDNSKIKATAILKENGNKLSIEKDIEIILKTNFQITSIQGDVTKENFTIDLNKDKNLEIKTNIDRKVDKIKISIGNINKDMSINLTTDEDVYSISFSLLLTDELKEALKGNNKITLTAMKGKSTLATADKYIRIISEESTISEIKFQQKNNSEPGKYDANGENEATIELTINKIEKKEELSQISFSLPGFEVKEGATVDLNEKEKTAKVSFVLQKKKDTQLINGKIVGSITLIINQALIKSNFDVEIINSETSNNIEIKYYDYKTKQYIKLEDNIEELTITSNDIYNFSIKISGIEEGKNVKETVGSTTIELKYSNGIYSTGCNIKETGTYEVKIIVLDTIIRELKLNITIDKSQAGNKNLILYANGDRDKIIIPDTWDEGTTDKYSLNQHGTNGEKYFIFTDTKNSELSYFCFYHGKSLDPSDHYILYDAQEYTGLSPEQKLILAFLGEVKEFTDSKGQKITFNSELRFGVQQFYIWGNIKGQKVNYGIFETMIKDLAKLENGINKYINTKDMTITIDGKTKKLVEFNAVEYIAREQHKYDGTIFELGDYVQPFFKYTYELEEYEPPKIYLRKVDKTDTEKKLQATFEVFVKNDKGTYDPVEKNPVITSREEDIKIEDISLSEKAEYLIVEKVAPEGYKITLQYIKLKVDPDSTPPVTIEVYKANSKNEDGSAKPTTADQPVSEESLWSREEKEIITEKDGQKITYVIVVKNDIDTPGIKIKKVDKDTGNTVEVSSDITQRGQFKVTLTDMEKNKTIYSSEDKNETLSLNDKGELELPDWIYYFIEPNKKIKLTIEEVEAPYKYNKIVDYPFDINITLLEDGKWKFEEDWTTKDSYYLDVELQGSLIIIKVKNEKKGAKLKITKTFNYSEISLSERDNLISEESPVIFKIYGDSKCTKQVGEIKITKIYDVPTITLQGGEKINGLSGNYFRYYIKETTAPIGFKQFDGIIVLKVGINDEGEATAASIDNILKLDGSIFMDTIETDKIKKKELLSQIKSIEVTDDKKIVKFEVLNKKINIDGLGLQIEKIDGEDGSLLEGAIFDVTGDIEGTITSNKDILYYQEDKIQANSSLEITVEEILAPQGYELLEKPIKIKAYINDVGTIGKVEFLSEDTQGVEWNSEFTEEGFCLIKLKIKNNGNTKKDAQLPLLMYIEGKVFLDQPEGKNSEADGYYGENDQSLEGIIVELYEGNSTATIAKYEDLQGALEKAKEKECYNYIPQSVISHINKVGEREKQGITNVVATDAEGKFQFYGLDPDKEYTVKFTYNGMRYEEIKVSTTTKISGYDITKQNASKAIENKDEKNYLINTFKEIGPAPYNYKSPSKNAYNSVFTQTEVEKAILDGLKLAGGNYLKLYGGPGYENLDKYITDEQISTFIKDTKITAKIEGLGNILEEAENKIKEQNNSYENFVDINYVYPIVTVSSQTFIGEDSCDTAQTMAENQMSLSNGIVGYYIEDYRGIDLYSTRPGCGSEHYVTTYPKLNNIFYNYKGKEGIVEKTINLKRYEPCQDIVSWNPIDRCRKNKGEQEELNPNADKAILYLFKVEEGYNNLVDKNIRYAYFKNQKTYYATDNSKPGVYDKLFKVNTQWGWYDHGRDIETTYNDLVTNIETLNKAPDRNLAYANLGVLYRPTMDLGLYNDVKDAVITINGKTETYIYDKRAVNGGSFSFGVNMYDFSNPQDVEEQYSSYYKSLSDKQPKKGEVTEAKDYEPLGLREEDIFPKEEYGHTTDGVAEAGGYNYDKEIFITYKIRIVNQAGVDATVKEVVDYYSKDFEVVGVYKDAEESQTIPFDDQSKYSNRGYKKTPDDDEYKYIYIPLNETLAGGKDTYLYIKLKMQKPVSTLSGKLEEGYKTLNYAEINGYSTDIGVLDIDSVPGNILEKPNDTDYKKGESRFETGRYEDDEGKSPALIFQNPKGASRQISGTVFEDTTGSIEINPKESRDGDGQYNGDTPVVGAIVRLIEIDEEGNPKPNSINNTNGIRAETLTNEEGNYTFNKVVAGDYMIEFEYGHNYSTVLTKGLESGFEYNEEQLSQISQVPQYTEYFEKYPLSNSNLYNSKSYNGQDYENTIFKDYGENQYWYTIEDNRYSDAKDDENRRKEDIDSVTNNFKTITNKKAEILNSYKDSKINITLLQGLIDDAYMKSSTKKMSIEIEYYGEHPNMNVKTNDKGEYKKEYLVNNVDFGIVERERAELQITKTVREISIVDSTGKEITGGEAGEDVKYVKWIQGPGGFVDMEIDSELLSGATLHVTYEIAVTNNSETSEDNKNEITNIQVIDYVSNNLNFDKTKNSEWSPVTVEQIRPYINNTSLDSKELSNKIDLSTYQTILMTTFGNIKPGETTAKTLTLEKNLSSSEDSDFNYENQVEIVQSTNMTGRGDYSSIYGNLDPTTYTSRQGNLNWDKVTGENERGFPQQPTDETVVASGVKIDNPNAIRLAEKDSGNAEEVSITPPTGAKGIVFETYHYVLALIGLLSLAGTVILIKKYIKMETK